MKITSIAVMAATAVCLNMALVSGVGASDAAGNSHAPAVEGAIDPFLGEPEFDVQQVFDVERFPNVVVTTKGTVLATWGQGKYSARRSEDGGVNWGEEIMIVDDAWQAGGVTVDETNGNIWSFVHKGGHPPRSPQTSMGDHEAYLSLNDGRTWEKVDIKIHPNEEGYVPALCVSEHGITLRHGRHKGRLLRPARVYYSKGANKSKGGYNTAIYSDDGGRTWHSSGPFPALGTGEGAVAELSDGTVYYNSRRSWAPEGKNPRRRWEAWSHDAGET